jgi:transposase-like protein
MDGLSGFPDAVRAVFPQTRIQRRIVHMVRNSAKFVSCKDLKEVCAGLKAIYRAPGEEAGRAALEESGKRRRAKYPLVYQSWDAAWPDLRGFFKYPEEIRRAVCTANAIESLNCRLRKVAHNRSALVSDDAIYKIMCLALRNAAKKWTVPVKDWGVSPQPVCGVFRRAGSGPVNFIYTKLLTGPFKVAVQPFKVAV